MSHDSRSMIPPGVARKLTRSAAGNTNAIVVGNRAGVIEWANDAWTRVTGYALDESISKPVHSFLRTVDVGWQCASRRRLRVDRHARRLRW